MHRMKVKGSKKKGVKSKIKKGQNKLALGQASTTIAKDKKLDKNELLDVTPLDKRLKGLRKRRHNKKQRTLMSTQNAHVCKVCGLAFKTVCTLKYHLSYYGDPTYPCQECGTKFADEKQLEFHVGQVHVFKPVRKYKFQCLVCNQVVKTHYSLRSHLCHYHKGWENLHPNLFASKAETTTTVTAGFVEKHKKELKNEEKCMVRRSEARVLENIEESTEEPENNGNVSSSTITLESHNFSTISLKNHNSSTITMENHNSSTITLENHNFSTITLENHNSSTIPLQNSSSMLSSEPDISEKISPELKTLLTKPLQNNSTTVESADINVKTVKTLDNEITETMASEIDTTENAAVNITVMDTKGAESNITKTMALESYITKTTAPKNNIIETMAPEIKTIETTVPDNNITETMVPASNITESMSPESNITESTVPKRTITGTIALESKIAKTTAPENTVTETKSSEKNIPEAKSPKDNTSETQGSGTNALAPPIDCQNHITDENKKNDASSRLDDETISPSEKDTPSQKVIAQSDVPVNDQCSSFFVKMRMELDEVATVLGHGTTAVSEKNDRHGKSLHDSQHPEDVKKFHENSCIESNSANAVVPVAGELNRNNAPTDGSTIQIDREAELNALHSCKDCYVPLTRLNVNKKKKRRRGPARITASRSPGTLFTSKPIQIAPLIDLSVAKPKYRKIISGPSTLFPCEHCTESFNSHASRLMHIELRHTVVPSIVCDKTFSTRQAMLRHYRERHFVYTENKTFCVCGMELVGQTAIHRHFYQYAIQVHVVKDVPEASHSACNPLPTNFGCGKCGATFWLKTCLQYHQTLDCERSKAVVSKDISSPTGVRKRYKRRCRMTRSHICIVCDTVFSNAQQLARHETKYSRREKHQCRICGTVFNGTRLLSGHIQTTHKRDPAKHYPYYCRICDQGFTASSAERIHRMHFHRDRASFVDEVTTDSDFDELPMTDSDLSDDETTKECNVCGHEFTSGQRFINHLVYYTRSEIIECGICLEEFAGQYQAHHHNKLVHYTSESRDAFPHHCTICREGFMWSTHLHAHLCHVHGVPAIEAQCMMNLTDSRRNNSQKVGLLNVADTCKICDITFASPVLLAAHEMENLNDGEFVCNKCSRRCRTASILLDHLSLNHSSTIIQDGVKCRRCNERFQTRSTWVSHVKHFHFTKEPSEFYFEKNIASSEKFMRSLRYELNVPTNSSITSGLASFRIKISFGDSSYTPDLSGDHRFCSETIVPDKNVVDPGEARNFIKIEATPTNECRNNGQIVGSDPETASKCAICSVNFRGPAELARHMALFSDGGHYMCELCGRRFAWLSIYEEHKKKHYRNDIDKFFCPMCNEGFKTSQSKISHEAHLHKRPPGVHGNEHQSIDNSQQLKSPYRPLPHSKLPSIVSFFQSGSANEQRSNRYMLGLPDQRKCEEQSQETGCWPRVNFRGPAELARHMALFSDGGHYMCELCGRRFAWLSIYEEHKKKHCRNDIDKLFCPMCNEGFETSQSKISHEAHLHKRPPRVHGNEHQSIDNSQQLKSPNRPLPHSKLPSIVSFFQSGSANEQRSNRYVLGLPDQRKCEEQSQETGCWPRLHTEIFEDELSMSYQCPNCQEKYPTLEEMHEHVTIAHNMKQDLSEDAYEHSSVDLPQYSPVDLPEDSAVDLPANRPVDSPEVSRIFIDSVKCDICDMHFVSENLLIVHKNTIHSSSPVVVRKIHNNMITVGNHSSGKRLNSTDHTYNSEKPIKLLPNGQVRKRRYQVRNRPDQSTKSLKPWAKASSNQPQPVGEATSATGLRDSVNGTLKHFQMEGVRCDTCDIVFMNKKVLQAHEVNIHGLVIDDHRPSDDSSKGERSGSSSPAIHQQGLFVGKLPTASKNVDATAIMDFESVMIPVTTYDFNITPTKTEKSSETSKPIEDSFSDSNVDSLPAMNYKVSQLKVRPFAEIVKKLRNQNVQKLSKSEHVKSTEPAAKRIKKVFDPVAYRELCEQHNLTPASVKSRMKLPATEPENTCR